MITGKDFFYCYNYKLNKYLQERGFKFITRAINPESKKIFNMYYNTKELTNAINNYKKEN